MMPRQMQILIHFLKMMILSCRVKIPEDPVLSFLTANDLLVFESVDSQRFFLDVDVKVPSLTFDVDVEVLELPRT
jgi:hypothetical protein